MLRLGSPTRKAGCTRFFTMLFENRADPVMTCSSWVTLPIASPNAALAQLFLALFIFFDVQGLCPLVKQENSAAFDKYLNQDISLFAGTHIEVECILL